MGRAADSRYGLRPWPRIEAGKIAITSAETLVTTPTRSTSSSTPPASPASPPIIDLTAMEHGKHLVMMNVEADVTIGPYLKRSGRQASALSIPSAPATSPLPAWN
jgi:predicted homoserine dehydrogenase-like protein